MTGNMAIGATGTNAADNAFNTGKVIGEELKALGFNINFAPDIDVNNNPANPVIGTRSFSDDAKQVAILGTAYSRGLAENQIIATYKHFPGHGDTSTDSHIGTPSVEKTYEQIKETELIPFAEAIRDGADLIMTAHITYPQIDEEKVFGDGKTKGYYPATMSRKMITDILRSDMGYEGVVVTDALEMDAIRTAGLVPGELDSTEYRINIAQEVINAGVDILLLPRDMTDADAVKFYDDYIAGLAEKVKNGSIDEKRIDESVLRILNLKDKYGILDTDITGEGLDQVIAEAEEQVGSEEHHKKEMEIARQAVTLVKNEDGILPVKGNNKHIVILGRNADDNMTIAYTIQKLQDAGVIDRDAKIENLVTGKTVGVNDTDTKITIEYYFEPSGKETQLYYTEKLKQAISEADVVIGLTKTFNLTALGEESAQYQGIRNAISDTHAASGKFILISDNLPYDAARYQDADAIILSYMGSGLDLDPTARADGSANQQAFNANVVAALQMIFGEGKPQGILPVNIPKIEEDKEKGLAYTDEILYERGFGITGWDDTKPANPFKDVKNSDYFFNAVLWSVGHEPQITNGTSETTFSPEDNCTRAQIVAFLWRAKGCPEPANTTDPFTDVEKDAYYYKAVLWAAEQGITTGTDPATFSPDGTVDRAQSVTFLWRSEGSPSVTAANPFTDIDTSAYYAKAVDWAVRNQITTGKTETLFAPEDPCTRAQIVTFLYRDLA